MLSVYAKTKNRRFSNSSDLKGVFEKLRYRNGLVWTISLAIEIKLRFDLYSTKCRRCFMCQMNNPKLSTLDGH